MKFLDIPKLTKDGHYSTIVSWEYLEDQLSRYVAKYNGDLDPDFQRCHVWDEVKQIAYVEHILRGGVGSKVIKFNCVGWMDDFRGPFVLVDGKQRLEAVRKFLRNELMAFGYYFKDFEGHLPSEAEFIFMINNLTSRKEVLQWYLEINSGGVVHTAEELQKVEQLLRNL